jgi:hypothetical protein
MKQAAKQLKSQNGMATIESLPILIIFVMLIAYMFGSFGIIHTGILHSIAARTYAMETFRHRSNLTYFREVAGTENYAKIGTRFHGIANENFNDPNDGFLPTQRSISMVMTTDPVNEKNQKVHSNLIGQVKDGVRVRENVAVNPVWIRIQYGICIDARCGE